MQELVRSSDPVFISFLEALLRAEGITVLVSDRHMAAVHGNIDAFPRRIWVDDDDLRRARNLVEAAGYGAQLTPLA